MSSAPPVPPPDSPADPPPAVSDALMQRRFALMASQVRSMRWSLVLVVGAVAGVALQGAAPLWVAAWAMSVLGIHAVRVRLFGSLARHDTLSGWRKVQAAWRWNLALGLAFGASALFMQALSLEMRTVLTLIVVSTAAGAVAISGPLLSVYLAYTLSIMVPYGLAWALRWDVLGLGLTVLMGVFIVLQTRFARTVGRLFDESFRMREDNDGLVVQLTQARDEAEAASQAKTRFLAAASHDLRQPLHALSLQSSALVLDPRAPDTPEIAAAIAHSIEDVSALLDSLLDISKLDAGTLEAHPRPIHLSRLVDALGRSVAPLARAKGLGFVQDCPSDVVAVTDPQLLERVLRNLLDNSLKFTDSGELGLALRTQNGQVQIEVRDSGAGIPQALQQKVFEEFYQIDRFVMGHSRGLGLGLSIVRRIANLLRITVTLRSAPGEGTTVLLDWPLVQGVVPAPQAPPAPGPALRQLKVLVLDDEPAICQGMCTLLQRLGCEVRTAATLDEALALVAATPPQVLLVDYRLGHHHNGIVAIARLREACPAARAVLISGDTAPDRLREAEASGLMLLHKPVSLDVLRQTLGVLVPQGGPAGAARTGDAGTHSP